MTVDVPIAEVVVGEGRRELRGLDVLAASIREVGLLNPITVTEDMRLVAGYHRLEACRTLGWDRIPSRALGLDELDAKLAELDENLIRNELIVLERAECLKQRKELYEAKYPETRQGIAGGKARHGSATEMISFADETASKTGKTPRTVQQEVQIAQNLDAQVKKDIRQTPVADSKTDLLRLARMNPERQRAVADRIAAGSSKSVKDAARSLDRAEQVEAIRCYTPPKGRFGVIVADPPWPYECRTKDPSHRGSIPYPSMSIEDICDMEIPADDDCVLWLWTTNAFMRESFRVIDAWGFREKTILTWVKNRVGVGNWLRGQTEHCVLAIRGNPVVDLTNQSTLLQAPLREHSRKPTEFYALVEGLCPATPRLELFAREQRDGWSCAGVEVEKFSPATLEE